MNYLRHDTTGLQPVMMLLWAAAGIPLGVYNIVQSFNIALQIQPQILTVLSLATWAQCQYYGNTTRWPWQKCLLAVTSLGFLMAAIEVSLIFGLKAAVACNIDWPLELMAALSAALLCAGVLRHYWDIYRERTVRGISFIFVGIDAMGDLTSLISVFFQPELDVLGMVIYGSELVLWLGVFACGGWYNFRPKVKKLLATRRERTSLEVVCSTDGDHSTEIPQYRMDVGTERPVSPSSSTVFRTASSVSSTHEIRLRTTVSA